MKKTSVTYFANIGFAMLHMMNVLSYAETTSVLKLLFAKKAKDSFSIVSK